MSGIGSGLGGWCAVAEGTNTGASGGSGGYGGTFVSPSRAVVVKSAKGTWDPHIVQGGPYIRHTTGGGVIDIGSANVAVYLDAKVALSGDFMNTGMALLLAQAFGIVGASGALVGASGGGVSTLSGSLFVQDGTWFDMELGVPDVSGFVHAQNYHSNKITKAEWVFPRDNLVTFSYDVDSCYVELGASGAAGDGPPQPTAPIPFSMISSSSIFTVGGDTLDGCRKATVTITPKLATDRIYCGNQYKDEPISNGLIEVLVALDMDYTPTADSELFQYFIQPTRAPLASTVITASAIAASGASGATGAYGFTLTFPELRIMSGGESPLEGVDIVKNTVNLKATLSGASGSSPSTTYTTPDTGY